MAEKDSRPPTKPPTGDASKGKGPSASQDTSLASRIGSSAGGLIGDLLAPTSSTQTLASTAAQSKGARGESSASGAATAAQASTSGRLGRGQAAGSSSLGSFRSARDQTAYDEDALSQAPVYSPEIDTTFSNLEGVEQMQETRQDATKQAPPLQVPRDDGESFEDYNQRLLHLERDAYSTVRLSAAARVNAEADAATWIAQFNDASAGERSYYRDVMKHVRAGSAASERGWQQSDGDDVLKLLDGGPLDLEDDATNTATAATEKQSTEPEVTADDLFGGEETFTPIARDNHVNLKPDFAAMDPRVDPVSGITISHEQNMRDVLDRMTLLDQWNEVLDSYTSDVWAPEQMAKAEEARKELEAARREAATTPAVEAGPEHRPALRRLQDLMGQLESKSKSTQPT